jgi:hypothetical protein
MDNISLITTALEYYDSSCEIYEKLLKNITYVKFILSENDIDKDIIILYDDKKQEVIRSTYEIIGLYNTNSNTWTWAWAISSFKKNSTNIARKIWNYGAVLDPSVKYLKTELVTSRFRVADSIQLDIHVGIASYLSKNPLIYKYFIYMNPKKDADGYVHIKENISDDYTIYYMFLLDYKNIEKNSNSVTESCTD